MKIADHINIEEAKPFLWVVAIIFIIYAISWYREKNDKPYDWCFQLPKEKSSYCVDLYWQSVDYQKNFQEKYGDPHQNEDLPL